MKNPNMRASLRSILLGSLCGLLSIAQPAQGAVALSLTDTIGAPNSAEVNLNNPASRFFTFRLTLNATTESTTGLTYFLEAPDFGGNGQFRIVSRDTTGSTYSDLTTSDATVLTPVNALLDPQNNNDLGATVADVINGPNAPGTYSVAEYVVEALSTISPGTYTIQTGLQSVTGGGPNFDEITVPRATYTVNVVPEPATACLLCLGSALISFARRNRVS